MSAHDAPLLAAIARAKANGWDADEPLPDRSPPEHVTDDLAIARYWLANCEHGEAKAHTLIDIAESLRRIANHLDRKDTAP